MQSRFYRSPIFADMISIVTRKEMFLNCAIADEVIAKFQVSYGSDFDSAIRSHKKTLRTYYDHLKPFRNTDRATEKIVLALKASTLSEYTEQFPKLLQELLQNLGIKKVFLADFLNTDLSAFQFKDFSTKNNFKRLTGRVKDVYAIELSIEKLSEVFALFMFPLKFDIPLIFIFSADEKIPLCIDLCDDGNLHIEFSPELLPVIKTKAETLGFVTGGGELCSEYSVCYLKNK